MDPTVTDDIDDWDEQWIRISDMDSGSTDPFPEFAEDVRAAMEHVCNEVGRPLTVKVTIQVSDGSIDR